MKKLLGFIFAVAGIGECDLVPTAFGSLDENLCQRLRRSGLCACWHTNLQTFLSMFIRIEQRQPPQARSEVVVVVVGARDGEETFHGWALLCCVTVPAKAVAVDVSVWQAAGVR